MGGRLEKLGIQSKRGKVVDICAEKNHMYRQNSLNFIINIDILLVHTPYIKVTFLLTWRFNWKCSYCSYPSFWILLFLIKSKSLRGIQKGWIKNKEGIRPLSELWIRKGHLTNHALVKCQIKLKKTLIFVNLPAEYLMNYEKLFILSIIKSF